MIKFISYTDNGVIITDREDGELFQEITVSDILEAIEHRLKNMPLRTEISYFSHRDDVCFLSKLAYDIDISDQYLELTRDSGSFSWDKKFILNFTQYNYLSRYSITFKGDLKKALLNHSYGSFSELVKAPLISLEEFKEKHLPFNFCGLEKGRHFLLEKYGNNLYETHPDEQFCLPIRELVDQAVADAEIFPKYISVNKIETIYDKCTFRLNIKINCSNGRYGIEYEGYIDPNKFELVLESSWEWDNK